MSDLRDAVEQMFHDHFDNGMLGDDDIAARDAIIGLVSALDSAERRVGFCYWKGCNCSVCLVEAAKARVMELAGRE